jgi:hypothetical protein
LPDGQINLDVFGEILAKVIMTVAMSIPVTG